MRYYRVTIYYFDEFNKRGEGYTVIAIKETGLTEEELQDSIKKGIMSGLHKQGLSLNTFEVAPSDLYEYASHLSTS